MRMSKRGMISEWRMSKVKKEGRGRSKERGRVLAIK